MDQDRTLRTFRFGFKPPDSQSGDRGFESRHRRQNGGE